MNKFILIIVSFFLVHAAVAQTEKLRTFKTKLTAQNTKPANNFLDLKSKKLFEIIGASYEPSRVDLFVIFGTRTRMNLLVPTSEGMFAFGDYFKINVYDGWDVKNKGLLINLSNSTEVVSKFNSVNTTQELQEWFDKAKVDVLKIDKYQIRENGPIDNLIRIDKGDIILFQSIDRNFYAVGQVLNIVESHEGSITIEWKAPK